MLLAFDIGNTNIVIGLFENNKLKKQWRLATDRNKTTDDLAIDFIELFLTDKIDCIKIEGVIIGSVVPTLTNKVFEAAKKFTSTAISDKIFVIGDNKTELNIDIKITNKKEVGHDRLINAISAFEKFGGNLIVVDFGTATTFDVIGKNGEYLGGIIAPGINLSLKALHEMTAQLPKISVKKQSNVIGKTTIEAMNSGVYFGYLSLIEGLFARIEKELGCKTKHVLTGGLSEIFKDDLGQLVDHFEPHLTIEGLQIIYNQNN